MSKKSRRDRGDGALYQTDAGLWVGAVTLPMGGDGKRRRKTVSSMDYAVAVAKLRELRQQVEDSGGDIPTASTTVTKWLDQWLRTIVTPNVRPNTREQYASDVRLHISPAVGRYRLDQLQPAHVRAMHAAIIAKGRSSTSAMRCHTVLSKALKDAMREGLIRRNVAELVKRPARAVNSRGALTATQAIAFLRHHRADPMVSRWAAALYTGARQGELLGLQRDRIISVVSEDGEKSVVLDLSWQLQRIPYAHGCDGACGKKRAGSCPARYLLIPNGFEYRVLEGALCLTRPKSKAGTRVVPIGPALAAWLAEHVDSTDPGPHNLVWSNAGHPIEARDDAQAWDGALRAAKLPDVPLHAARHTTATLLQEDGVDESTIQAMLGQSSIIATRGYIHVQQGTKRAAMLGLDERLALD